MGVLGGFFGGKKEEGRKSRRGSRRKDGPEIKRPQSGGSRRKKQQKKKNVEDLDIDLSAIEEEETVDEAPSAPPSSHSTAVMKPKAPADETARSSATSRSGGGSISRRKRSSIAKKLLGNLLVKGQSVSENQVQKALARQEEEGGLLGQHLVEQGACNRAAIAGALRKQRTITTVELTNVRFDPDATALVGRDQCEKHRLIPFEKMGQMLCIAMSNVLDSAAKNEIREQTQLTLKTFDAAWPEIQAAIEAQYGAAGPAAAEPEDDVIELDDEEAAPVIEIEEEDADVVDLGEEEAVVVDLAEEEAETVEPAEDAVRIDLPDEDEPAPAAPSSAAAPSIAPAAGGAAPVAVVRGGESEPLAAIPVTPGYYRRVVTDGGATIEARWLAERAGMEVLPALPADGNGSDG